MTLAISLVSLYKPTLRAERQGMPSRSEHNLLILKECEMPKLKTKSSAKKRFRLTGSGKVRANVALKQHGMSKRPQKMKRKARGTMILCAQDARIVKSYMPNA
jgi:large subunit ribosomal protein L35